MAAVLARYPLAARAVRRLVVQSERNSGNFYGQHDFDNYRHSLYGGMSKSEHTGNRYKKIFFFFSIPVLLASAFVCVQDHEREHKEERKEHVAYDYLTVRNKPFPWGDGNHALFHNPTNNWVPGVGFEKEKEVHHH